MAAAISHRKAAALAAAENRLQVDQHRCVARAEAGAQLAQDRGFAGPALAHQHHHVVLVGAFEAGGDAGRRFLRGR